MRSVQTMVEEEDLDPRVYAYPGLAFYLPLAAAHCEDAIGGLIPGREQGPSMARLVADTEAAIRRQRLLSVLFSTATVLIVYLIGTGSSRRSVGLWAAACFATAHLPVQQAHFGVVDSATTFFTAVALWGCSRAAREGSLRAFALAGALSGIATATRYLPAILALPLVAAGLRCGSREGLGFFRALLGKRLWLAGGMMVGAFLACAPYTLLHWDAFTSDFRQQASLSVGVEGHRAGAAILKHLSLSLPLGLGWPLFSMSVVGMVIGLRRRSAEAMILVAYTAAFMGLLGLSRMEFIRYVLPLSVVCTVFAAQACVSIGSSVASRFTPASWIIWPLLAGAMIGPSLHRTIASDLLFSRSTSFELLREWHSQQPGTTHLAFTSPRVAEILQLERQSWPYDPPRIAFGEDVTHVVVADHPNPHLAPPLGVERLLAASASAEIVLRIPAFESGERERVVFDRRDAFFYPYSGFGGVLRGGPDLTVYRITPGPRPANLPPPPPPPRGADGGQYRRRPFLAWRPDPGVPPLAYYLRCASQEEAGVGRVPEPVAVPAGVSAHVFPPVSPGSYWLSVSAVGLAGEGLLRVVGPIHVP